MIKNDEPLPNLNNFRSVVISPGPGLPQTSGNLMQHLTQCIGRVPLLGVCLGHQALAHFYGAKLVKAPEIFHGRVSEIIHSNNKIFSEIPRSFLGNRYHSWVVSESDFPTELEVTARTKHGEIMGIMSRTHQNVFGLQFHPESILTEYGKKMIQNFCEI